MRTPKRKRKNLKALRAKLKNLETIFEARGGRGVELADSIDALRAQLEK